MFVKINQDGNVQQYPYSLNDFMTDHSDVIYDDIKDNLVANLEAYNVFRVAVASAPTDYDPATHKVVKHTVPTLVDGVWTLNCEIREYTTADTHEKAIKVRADRNALLAESDYTQLADYPSQDKAAWAVYRQALRDLPAQAGFPHSLEWPVKAK